MQLSLKYISVLAVAVVMLFIASVVFAETQALSDAEVATDYWPPFVIESQNGTLQGIDIDLLRVIGKRMDLNFSIKRYPWARCLKRIKAGTSDLITGVAKSEERAATMIFTESPYYSCRPAFYSLAGDSVRVGEYNDLKGKRIGYTRNSLYFPQFDNDTELNKYAANNEKQLLNMLIAGRLSLIVGTDCQVDYDIALRGINEKVVKEPFQPEYKVDLYLGISLKSRWRFRIKELNAILREMVENSTVQNISDRYFNNGHISAAEE